MTGMLRISHCPVLKKILNQSTDAACLPRYFRRYARCVNTTERRFSMTKIVVN
ncbi:unnamed protein product [Acanthoscelides obtectus]|uniref:Uncharacterized protein n=1 Tax=Acanthoscelides obtectus TaxID=200917 RepID=A0A9P0L6H2_ACAOB|nr:unnamed protein product [Acanthoscelides obtectus]CAK1627745.1 hypothetical protein AOBTE_LOCUS4802 [Acanthoscelides obtectus]